MKARFLKRQQTVKWQPLNDEYVDVAICMNETAKEDIFEDPDDGKIIQHYFEYDFNQFREKIENLDRDFVEGNPERYLGYVPTREKTLQETVASQENKIEMLENCLLEMSMTVYA